MAQRIIDPLEVVEIQVEHRERAAVFLGGLYRSYKATARLLAVRQSRQRIEIGKLDDAALGTPFAAQRNRHLSYFMGMKRLLQV